ncbi:MAG: hypothetical protein Q8Q90_00440 [bacterium]|nr:hypothetical protein [bacterium]
MNLTKIVIGILIGGVVGLIGYGIYDYTQPGKYDSFATCIKDSGATFYGAFWCPHCQNQKKLFGKSERLLPYVECSLPSGQGQTQNCIDKKIEGYPTWEFKDGTRATDVFTLQELAEKTSCTLTEDKK